MTEDNSIWIVVEDAPEASETEEKSDRENPENLGKTVTQKATRSVRMSAAILQNRMSEFFQVIGDIFQQADRELSPTIAMQLEEVQLSIDITAEGEVKLLGTGGKFGSQGAIGLKFKRKISETHLSQNPEIEFKSAKGINYARLWELLKEQLWEEADLETMQIILQVMGREEGDWLDVDSIENFPSEDLQTIDRLWVHYSNGLFGFSVQKQIWEELGGQVDWEMECELGDLVGWRKDEEWVSRDDMNFSLEAPLGHLPRGLAWCRCPGVSWGGVLLSHKDL